MSNDSPTASDNQPVRRFRTEAQLRGVLSMLCDFVWNGRLKPGQHMWSIPVDLERDFDCILSDAIDELVEWRERARVAGLPAVSAGSLSDEHPNGGRVENKVNKRSELPSPDQTDKGK